MALLIFTKRPGSFLSHEALKRLARRLLRRHRGPQGVIDSLCRGLTELGVSYKMNPRQVTEGDVVYVNYSLDAWRWLLRQKKKKTFRLIVGPNILTQPLEADGILLDTATDLYLVPSQWVFDWWMSLRPDLKNRLKVWAAGVPDRGLSAAGDLVLVYRKTVPEDIWQLVLKVLEEEKILYKIITYGHFQQPEYFRLLQESRLMVYLQTSESQGLSLLEAWSFNVPTLVWRSGYYDYQGASWSDPKVSAPYLTDAAGQFFETENDLRQLLKVSANFSPREYFLEKFTDKKCAQNFLLLTKEHNQPTVDSLA